MKDYIYDGSFEGLLTAIFYAYPAKEHINIVKEINFIPSLLNTTKTIDTEIDKFTRVYTSINEKLNLSVLENIYLVYLSDIKGAENVILDYLRLCYKYGIKINLAKNNDTIILIDRYSKKVTNEAHLLTGFIRFKEISPARYYSSIEPEYNILPLIEKHFTKRFSDQYFIIHDIKRSLAIVYNGNSSIITHFDYDNYKQINNNYDIEYSKLWKTFYNSVNIEERRNIRCMKQHMPRKYWGI